jgi:hypothetical protein
MRLPRRAGGVAGARRAPARVVRNCVSAPRVAISVARTKRSARERCGVCGGYGALARNQVGANMIGDGLCLADDGRGPFLSGRLAEMQHTDRRAAVCWQRRAAPRGGAPWRMAKEMRLGRDVKMGCAAKYKPPVGIGPATIRSRSACSAN